MRRFDYTFLENGLLPADLVNIAYTIGELKQREKERRQDFPVVFSRMESIARVQSVKGSNAIEGIVTTDERISEIVNQNSAPVNHDEAEIAGYRDALAMIHDGMATLDIREADILGLHQVMLAYTPAGGGWYKDFDNVIAQIDAQGMRKVRFAPTPAADTPAAMEQLILAYMEARSNPAINPLLLIPSFILDFLCIHPFADGNGRMSRLLSLLMLYKSGFDAGRFISFEEQINQGRGQYYEALRLSSQGWHTNENTYFPFIGNFITTLMYCYKELDKRFAVVNARKVTKRLRVEATILNSLLPISKQEICGILPDVSPTTVEAILADMVRNQQVEKIGAGRSTRYVRHI